MKVTQIGKDQEKPSFRTTERAEINNNHPKNLEQSNQIKMY
jgi:hypothetical protein